MSGISNIAKTAAVIAALSGCETTKVRVSVGPQYETNGQVAKVLESSVGLTRFSNGCEFGITNQLEGYTRNCD